MGGHYHCAAPKGGGGKEFSFTRPERCKGIPPTPQTSDLTPKLKGFPLRPPLPEQRNGTADSMLWYGRTAALCSMGGRFNFEPPLPLPPAPERCEGISPTKSRDLTPKLKGFPSTPPPAQCNGTTRINATLWEGTTTAQHGGGGSNFNPTSLHPGTVQRDRPPLPPKRALSPPN